MFFWLTVYIAGHLLRNLKYMYWLLSTKKLVFECSRYRRSKKYGAHGTFFVGHNVYTEVRTQRQKARENTQLSLPLSEWLMRYLFTLQHINNIKTKAQSLWTPCNYLQDYLQCYYFKYWFNWHGLPELLRVRPISGEDRSSNPSPQPGMRETENITGV